MDPESELQHEYDLDSTDELNFVEGIRDRTGIAVPEHDHPQAVHARRLRRYLMARQGATAGER